MQRLSILPCLRRGRLACRILLDTNRVKGWFTHPERHIGLPDTRRREAFRKTAPVPATHGRRRAPLERIKVDADRRHIPHQSLIKAWLAEARPTRRNGMGAGVASRGQGML
jgi:hypothetical protein